MNMRLRKMESFRELSQVLEVQSGVRQIAANLFPAIEALPIPQSLLRCPMHPKVRQDAPGTCAKCGMQLVPGSEKQTLGTMLQHGPTMT